MLSRIEEKTQEHVATECRKKACFDTLLHQGKKSGIRCVCRQEKMCFNTLSCNKKQHRNTLRLKARKIVLQDALLQQGESQEYIATEGKKKRASRRSLATRKTQEYVAIEGRKRRASRRSLATRKNKEHVATEGKQARRASRRSRATRKNTGIRYDCRQEKTCFDTLSCNEEKLKNTLRLKAGQDVLTDALWPQGKTQEYDVIEGKKKRASRRSPVSRKNAGTRCD
jgi:hypothetical protein